MTLLVTIIVLPTYAWIEPPTCALTVFLSQVLLLLSDRTTTRIQSFNICVSEIDAKVQTDISEIAWQVA